MFDLIAFDADDTLWHNEALYVEAQDRLKQLLAPYAPPDAVQQALDTIEQRNLPTYGYGIKGFALSMIETAVLVSKGRVTAHEVQQIIGFAHAMLEAPVRLLEGARECIAELAPSYRLMLITKGDLLDQQRKIAGSGLEQYLTQVEIVSSKTDATYAAILARHAVAPSRFLMVGNSLKSDILPVLEIGGHAVYIPYHTTWNHEVPVESALTDAAYHQLESISALPDLVLRLAGS